MTETCEKRACATTLLRFIEALCLIAGLAICVPAAAQDPFSSKPIRIVVPFGSGSDTATRILTQHLGPALKQTTITDNRAGTNGSITIGLLSICHF